MYLNRHKCSTKHWNVYRQPILNETANFVNQMPSLNSPSLEIKTGIW